MIEAAECLTRLIGQMNTHVLDGRVARSGWARRSCGSASSTTSACEAQIDAADGLLDGLVIWGDVAYRKALFFVARLLADVLQAVGQGDDRAVATGTACR